jgi:hypothetical protein
MSSLYNPESGAPNLESLQQPSASPAAATGSLPIGFRPIETIRAEGAENYNRLDAVASLLEAQLGLVASGEKGNQRVAVKDAWHTYAKQQLRKEEMLVQLLEESSFAISKVSVSAPDETSIQINDNEHRLIELTQSGRSTATSNVALSLTEDSSGSRGASAENAGKKLFSLVKNAVGTPPFGEISLHALITARKDSLRERSPFAALDIAAEGMNPSQVRTAVQQHILSHYPDVPLDHNHPALATEEHRARMGTLQKELNQTFNAPISPDAKHLVYGGIRKVLATVDPEKLSHLSGEGVLSRFIELGTSIQGQDFTAPVEPKAALCRIGKTADLGPASTLYKELFGDDALQQAYKQDRSKLPEDQQRFLSVADYYREILAPVMPKREHALTPDAVKGVLSELYNGVTEGRESCFAMYICLIRGTSPLRTGSPSPEVGLSEMLLYRELASIAKTFEAYTGGQLKFTIVDEAPGTIGNFSVTTESIEKNHTILKGYLELIGADQQVIFRNFRADLESMLGRDLVANSLQTYNDLSPMADHRANVLAHILPEEQMRACLGDERAQECQIRLLSEKLTEAALVSDFPELLPHLHEPGQKFSLLMSLRGAAKEQAKAYQQDGVEVPEQFDERTLRAGVTADPSRVSLAVQPRFMGQSVLPMHGLPVFNKSGEFLGNMHLSLALKAPECFEIKTDDVTGRIEFVTYDPAPRFLLQLTSKT